MVWKDIERKMGFELQDPPGTGGAGGPTLTADRTAPVAGAFTGLGAGGSGGSRVADGTDASESFNQSVDAVKRNAQQKTADIAKRMEDNALSQIDRENALKEIREIVEFMKNLLAIELEFDTLEYKLAKSFGQGLGQIVV
jgi:hypothetical protein